MQKKLTIFLAILSLTVFLGGCVTKTVSDNKDQIGGFQRQGQNNFFQPEKQADITGVVKSITGNQTVVSKLDVEKMMEEMKANMPSPTPNGDFNNNSDTEKKTSNLVQTNGGPGGMGGRPDGPGRRPDEEDTNSFSSRKNEILSELLKNSLGDEQVLIPVGIQMTKRGGEASLSDITAGTMVSIWLTDTSSSTDRKIAEFVSIR